MKPIAKNLKNGMRAIIVPQKGVASMTIMIFVKVGSRYERKEINGASHFIEHLMFKGTKRRGDTLAISKELDRYGAEYNAFTSKDLTAYYIKMDAAKTELAVDLLHDMLFHSKYDSQEINRERGVIVEEINMYEDNPRMHIDDLLEAALFPDSTLGWNIAGPREVIKKIPRAELIAYRDSYYIPSRMAVAVAGKIISGIWPLLNKTFGKVAEPKKPGDRPFTPFAPPSRLAEPIAFQQKTTEQVQLGLAFHGFAFNDKETPTAALLADILGGTMSSRLFIQVRERRGLCYSINASHQPIEDTGIFSILSGLDKARVKEAVEVIRKELKKTTVSLVSAEELRRAKDHIRGRLTLAFEDSSTQADWYGKQWIFQKKLLTPEERLHQFEQVTPAAIRNVAKKIFNKDHMAAAVIGPFVDKQAVEKLFDEG